MKPFRHPKVRILGPGPLPQSVSAWEPLGHWPSRMRRPNATALKIAEAVKPRRPRKQYYIFTKVNNGDMMRQSWKL